MRSQQIPAGLKWSAGVLQFFAALLLIAVMLSYGFLAVTLLFSFSGDADLSDDDWLQIITVAVVTVVSHLSAQLMIVFADYLRGKKSGMSEKEIFTEMMWLAVRELCTVVLGFAVIVFMFTLILQKWSVAACAGSLMIASVLAWHRSNRQIGRIGREPDHRSFKISWFEMY